MCEQLTADFEDRSASCSLNPSFRLLIGAVFLERRAWTLHQNFPKKQEIKEYLVSSVVETVPETLWEYCLSGA